VVVVVLIDDPVVVVAIDDPMVLDVVDDIDVEVDIEPVVVADVLPPAPCVVPNKSSVPEVQETRRSVAAPKTSRTRMGHDLTATAARGFFLTAEP
jgi:hypothetical protein